MDSWSNAVIVVAVCALLAVIFIGAAHVGAERARNGCITVEKEPDSDV